MSTIRAIYILLTFVFVTYVFANTSLANDRQKDKFVKSFSERIIIEFCNNEKTLQYTNLSKKQCFPYIYDLSTECNNAIRELVPSIEGDESKFEDNDKKLESISILYVACIKSHIYENKEHSLLPQ